MVSRRKATNQTLGLDIMDKYEVLTKYQVLITPRHSSMCFVVRYAFEVWRNGRLIAESERLYETPRAAREQAMRAVNSHSPVFIANL